MYRRNRERGREGARDRVNKNIGYIPKSTSGFYLKDKMSTKLTISVRIS